MKAKEFLEFLCEGMDYRFFAGVPCKGFKPLYDAMHPRFLHYIPAARESVAIALASGAEIAGTKAVVIMSEERIYDIIDHIVSFNIPYGVAPLILAYSEKENKCIIDTLRSNKIPYRFVADIKKDFKEVIDLVLSDCVPSIAILRKGTII